MGKNKGELITGASFACLVYGCQASTDRHAFNERCLQAGCQEATEPAHVEDMEAARGGAYEAHRPSSGWIPVGERLPDTEREVLIAFDDTYEIRHGIGYWDDQKWRDGLDRAVPGVQFWRELPALPNRSARGQYAEPEMILPGPPYVPARKPDGHTQMCDADSCVCGLMGSGFPGFTGDLSSKEPTR